jgi:HPt (histidine-containing phosphotransfer) domain-containing protein
MKKLMIGLVAVSALVFGTGCGGGDYCEDLQDELESLNDKLDDCPAVKEVIEDELGELRLSDAEVDECKESSEDCSDRDDEKREQAIDCLRDLDRCEEDRQQNWYDDFAECFEDLQDARCD